MTGRDCDTLGAPPPAPQLQRHVSILVTRDVLLVLGVVAILLAGSEVVPSISGPSRSIPSHPEIDTVAGSTAATAGSGVSPAASPAAAPGLQAAPGATPSHDFSWNTARAPPLGSLGGSGFVADPSRSEAVLFGGTNSSGANNGTWLYRESSDTWTKIPTLSAPSPRSDFGFAGDPTKEIGVLFGGRSNATNNHVDADTWTYAFPTSTWTNVTHPTAPPARQAAAFAVAPSLGVGLLFGGWNQNFSGSGALIYGDAWSLNLTSFQWSRLSFASGPHPPPLQGARLSWDAARNQFELFGGCFPCTSVVWSYAPSTGTWTIASAFGAVPAPRGSSVWAYDPAQQRDVLFGGMGNVGPLNDTYEFEAASGNWTAQTFGVHPLGRYAAAATWMDVSTNESLLLTGGAGPMVPAELWRLAPAANLSIRVLNASSPVPVPKATVTVDGANPAFTNNQGYRNLTQVAPANHVIRAIAPGYARANQSVSVPPGMNFLVVLNLTPVPPANLSVLVTDLLAGPIAGADVNVTIQGVPFRTPPLRTDVSGRVNYTGIPTFPVNVTASARYFHSNTIGVNLYSGTTVNTVVRLTPYALAYVQVRGFFPPLDFALPLFGAQIVAGPYAVGRTDSGGVALVQLDVVGSTLFNASASGFQPGRTIANAPYSGIFLVNVTLTSLPFGTLNVQVLDDSTHLPIPAASVNLTPAVGSPIEALRLSAASGPLGIANRSYPPSNYSVEVWHPGYYPNGSITALRVGSGEFRFLTVNLTRVLGPASQNNSSSFFLLPPGRLVVWSFLVVPFLLLLVGGTYLSLLRGDRPALRRSPPARSATVPRSPLPSTPPPPPPGAP